MYLSSRRYGWIARGLSLLVPLLGAVSFSCHVNAVAAGEIALNHVRFSASDGASLHVIEAGNSAADQPVIAFVPGWCMPATLWEPQLRSLGRKYRVAALDPRGQGESDIPKGGYNIAQRADDIARFVERYPKVVLVAWSLAALESLQYIERHGGNRLAGLVIVDSSVGEGPDPAPSGGGFVDDLRQDRMATLNAFMRAIFKRRRSETEIDGLVKGALRMPLEDSITLFPSKVPRSHWKDIVLKLSVPVVYVVTPQFAEQARFLKQDRPATRIEVFKLAGHALFADEPGRFNTLIRDFISSLPR